MLIWGGCVLLLVGVGFFGIKTKVSPSPEEGAALTAYFFVRSGIKICLEFYKKEMGEYPSTHEGLQSLLAAPAGKEKKWAGPYAEFPNGKLPLDPWKQPYIYRQPGAHNPAGYDLFSKGPDKIAGTADDIGNW